ncbi:hypothetical protein [Lentimonas sp. CC19]|uniref:hypothetical protein n=1 Tax=Lentimonas sp. CC19 TaxID=2676097 RepID=UPI001A7F00F4|nr:hypothetical protein [Lentimonas sp. CC19]
MKYLVILLSVARLLGFVVVVSFLTTKYAKCTKAQSPAPFLFQRVSVFFVVIKIHLLQVEVWHEGNGAARLDLRFIVEIRG